MQVVRLNMQVSYERVYRKSLPVLETSCASVSRQHCASQLQLESNFNTFVLNYFLHHRPLPFLPLLICLLVYLFFSMPLFSLSWSYGWSALFWLYNTCKITQNPHIKSAHAQFLGHKGYCPRKKRTFRGNHQPTHVQIGLIEFTHVYVWVYVIKLVAQVCHAYAGSWCLRRCFVFFFLSPVWVTGRASEQVNGRGKTFNLFNLLDYCMCMVSFPLVWHVAKHINLL